MLNTYLGKIMNGIHYNIFIIHPRAKIVNLHAVDSGFHSFSLNRSRENFRTSTPSLSHLILALCLGPSKLGDKSLEYALVESWNIFDIESWNIFDSVHFINLQFGNVKIVWVTLFTFNMLRVVRYCSLLTVIVADMSDELANICYTSCNLLVVSWCMY